MSLRKNERQEEKEGGRKGGREGRREGGRRQSSVKGIFMEKFPKRSGIEEEPENQQVCP
jgi:hypothetical protein